MARPRQPTNVLALKGTFKANPKRLKAREGEPQPFADIGPAPEEFTERQRYYYDELVRLAHKGVLCESDGPVIRVGAILMARMMADPDEFSPPEFGRLQMVLSSLGMTPADRSRVKVMKPESQQANPLDEFTKAG